MSFDINPPRNNLSNVQASSKASEGGGGNTGYFRRDGDEEESSFNFKKDFEGDSFVREENLEEVKEQSFFEIIKNLFLDLIEAIKNFFVKK